MKKISVNKNYLMKIILIILIILLVSVTATYMFYSLYLVQNYREMPTDIIVKQSVGINLNKDAFHFGGMYPGGMAQRDLHIINNEKDYVVQIKITGNISQFVTISDNNFLVRKGETKTVTLTAVFPKGLPIGNKYEGMIKFYFKRPLFW